MVKQPGGIIIYTDDLVYYITVAGKLDVEHQICQYHIRCLVERILMELHETVPREWKWIIDEIKQLIA